MPWLILLTLGTIAVAISLPCGSNETPKSGEGSRHSRMKDAVGAPSAPGLAKTQETVTKKSEEKIQKKTTETVMKTESVKKTDTIIETINSPQGTRASASNYSQRFHSQEWFTEKEPRRLSAALREEETQLFAQPTECSSNAS